MNEIKMTLPDGAEQAYPAGISVQEIIRLWKPNLLSSTVAARINQTPVDLGYAVQTDGALSLIDIQSKEGLPILRHSISHVMAQAVQDTFDGVRVGIGPSIEDGFYYDFEYAETFTPEDLEKIEKRMHEITAADYPFKRQEMSREEAVVLFKNRGESYKVELLNDLPEDSQNGKSLYTGRLSGPVRGPHIPATGMIKAYKLLSVAGAYWRGDEKNKMLQRIYGTGFAVEEQLTEYLRIVEEAKKRDPPPTGSGTGSFPGQRGSRAGADYLSPQRDAVALPYRGVGAERTPEARLRHAWGPRS